MANGTIPLHHDDIIMTRFVTGAARRYFHTWNAALEAAGLDPQTIRYPPIEKRSRGFWSSERVLALLREHAAAGDALAAHTMDAREPGLVATAQHLFGTETSRS